MAFPENNILFALIAFSWLRPIPRASTEAMKVNNFSRDVLLQCAEPQAQLLTTPGDRSCPSRTTMFHYPVFLGKVLVAPGLAIPFLEVGDEASTWMRQTWVDTVFYRHAQY